MRLIRWKLDNPRDAEMYSSGYSQVVTHVALPLPLMTIYVVHIYRTILIEVVVSICVLHAPCTLKCTD